MREFLRQVSGEDFGTDDAAWLAWLDDFSTRNASDASMAGIGTSPSS